MTKGKPKTPLELAARALCQRRGLPEDTLFEGAKMWQAHLGEAMAVLQAALSPEDFRRVVLDHPWPGPTPVETRQTVVDPDN